MTIKNAPAGSIRSAMRYRGFRWLLSALAVSQIGDWLYNLALVVLVYDRTHSPLWAGLTTAARVVPMVALGPLGGIAADRFDRRRLMIGCDVARMALMLLLAAVTVARLPIVLAPVIAAMATAAATPYLPCASSITPRVVGDADLPGANAARSAVTGLGIIIGPAIGGVLLLLGSPAYAFALNALTFGFSALCVPGIGPAAIFRFARPAEGRAGLLRELAAGAAALRANRPVIRLVGADIMCSLQYGAQTVLLLAVATRAGLGSGGYGYLFTGIGAGGLLGTALASRAARCPHPRYVQVAALAAVGLPMPLLAAVHWPAAAILLAGLTGTGALLVEILTETCLQRSVDEEVFGRAYGLAVPASIGGIAAGALIAPLLSAALGTPGALIAIGGAVLAYAALLLIKPRTAHIAGGIQTLAHVRPRSAGPAASPAP